MTTRATDDDGLSDAELLARPRRRATPTRSASCSPGTATGSGRSRCAPWATPRTPPTGCRTAWSRRTAGPASFRGEAAVTTWLHRVVVNACLDRLRAAKVRRAEPLPDDLDEHAGRGSLRDRHRRPTTRPTAPVAEERRRLVLAALATLPAEQRAALVLVDMEGYPVAEVAEILDCAVGTVKSRCSRGRARLAGCSLGVLAPSGDPDHPPPGTPTPPAPVRSTRPRAGPPPADA